MLVGGGGGGGKPFLVAILSKQASKQTNTQSSKQKHLGQIVQCRVNVSCVQTFPICYFPFPSVTKEIKDVRTQASMVKVTKCYFLIVAQNATLWVPGRFFSLKTSILGVN